MTLTRERIAELREFVAVAAALGANTTIKNTELTALLDTAEVVATPCTWTQDEVDESWDSDCGEKWQLTTGGPTDNNVRFCHGCGKSVAVLPLAGEVAK